MTTSHDAGKAPHDPLCPTEQCCARDERATREFCECALITRVREDERPDPESAEADAYDHGYRSALRDAVEAVKALPVWKPMVDATVVDANEVIAAIKALGGER